MGDSLFLFTAGWPRRPDKMSGDRGSDLRQIVGASESSYMAYVYIIRSLDKGIFYIGSTVNLAKRMQHHYSGSTPTTKRFGKIELVLSQKYATISEARTIEKRLKRLKRKDYIEKIVRDGYIKLRI
jgi:putative endonuclease